MTDSIDLHDFALHYHRLMTDRIRHYLNARGIPDELIHRHLLGWSGGRITIPIPNRNGEIAFFKLAKDPEDPTPSPKMYATPGSSIELYGWEVVARKPQRVIIAEGEFDRLVLEANGFDAVTSTGGAGSFRAEWAEALAEVPEVFICYDRDEAGQSGALRVAGFLPSAKIVEPPEEVGEGGDVTDFFARLGRSREDFEVLLREARPAPLPPPAPLPNRRDSDFPPDLRSRADRVKRETRIEDLIGRFVPLRSSGKTLVGQCPLHRDRDPSFVVFPETSTFHCFGCRARGDVISFLQLYQGLSFTQALEELERWTSSP